MKKVIHFFQYMVLCNKNRRTLAGPVQIDLWKFCTNSLAIKPVVKKY